MGPVTKGEKKMTNAIALLIALTLTACGTRAETYTVSCRSYQEYGKNVTECDKWVGSKPYRVKAKEQAELREIWEKVSSKQLVNLCKEMEKRYAGFINPPEKHRQLEIDRFISSCLAFGPKYRKCLEKATVKHQVHRCVLASLK